MEITKKITFLIIVCVISVIFFGAILYNFNSSVKNDRTLSITFVGDIMLGRQVGRAMQLAGNPTLPFCRIYSVLAAADVTVGNLECVFVDSLITGTFNHTKILFPAYSESVQGLELAGFDFCSLANNHALDFGIDGVTATVINLERNDITPLGINGVNPEVFKIKGFSAALFAFWMNDKGLCVVNKDTGYETLSRDIVIEQIKQAKTKHDIVIVYIHWGKEYTSYPTDSQIRFARQAVQSGADLFVGHGPHQVQGIERYDKGLIAYSLGNCVFDQKYEETQTGLVLTVYFNHTAALIDTKVLPITIPEFSYVPVFIDGAEKDRVLSELSKLSKNVRE